MKIIHDTTEFYIEHKTAVAIGKFDGIHKGHIKLLSHILGQKKQGMQAVVFTFYPSASVFFGQGSSAELTTRDEKRKLFEHLGIDILIEFPLNKETAATDPQVFIKKILVEQMHAGYIAAGEDLSFGYKGSGNKELLIKMAESLGYKVEIIDKIFHADREISSTFVREAVESGDMILACQLLGRHYSFEGKVQAGNRLGRRLGMPTLNLYPVTEKLLPPKGVYYSRVLYENCVYPGITNIGYKPTVNALKEVSVETYLYDFDGDMYGKQIVTELLQFKRPEQKFENVQELKKQMERDIAEGRQFHD
ncbi:MAG: bifunctional riboflavin kinase/FAD synthetase [Lachnospiraceae bacterium]|nr:bifunctional riboflavin kinase/FAD synthetase [Lachnospiraceae bacterium]